MACAITITICAGVLYRSLSIRKALASKTYRSRALWTGAIATIIAAVAMLQIVLESLYPAYPSNGTPTELPFSMVLAYGALALIGVLIIFRWLDSTIEVAMDLDFRHRDAIGWKKMRRLSWAAAFVLAALSSLSTSGWEYQLLGTLIGVLFVYAGGALFVSARRMFDTTMKRYIRWMGLAVLAVLLEISTSTFNFYLNFPLAILAFILYRAATSLSKTTRMGLESDPTQTGSPEVVRTL